MSDAYPVSFGSKNEYEQQSCGYTGTTTLQGVGRSQQAYDPLGSLKYFLATAANNWKQNEVIKRFLLSNGEQISCIYWENAFYITGTDIVKIIAYRFQLINRAILNCKKFEEGIFSDLRNLKPGVDSILEESRSKFLDFLYQNGCIRTQKKQKIFYWHSVPHETLYQDSLERDYKRESTQINKKTLFGQQIPVSPYMSSMINIGYLPCPPQSLFGAPTYSYLNGDEHNNNNGGTNIHEPWYDFTCNYYNNDN